MVRPLLFTDKRNKKCMPVIRVRRLHYMKNYTGVATKTKLATLYRNGLTIAYNVFFKKRTRGYHF